MRLYKTLLAGLVLLMVGDFVQRGIVPAVSVRKNDFTDPWIGAWLWRHGQNPYDVALASAVNMQFINHDGPMVPIYPATTYMLLAPFSFLSWNTANLVWILLGLIGVAAIAFVLLRLGRFKSEDIRSWLLIAIVFSLTPLRAGLLVENPAIISISLCLAAVYLASREQDIASGITLAMATAVKPQLGIWVLVFYLVRRRWRLSLSCIACGVVVTGVALARIPLSPSQLQANYTQNLQHWFGPGGSNDFSPANPSRFDLVNLQVVLSPMVGHAASLLAYLVFAIGLGIWFWAVQRNPSCPDALALGSLLALSFLSVYHRSYDVGILTLTLCWTLGRAEEPYGLLRRSALILTLLFLTPERVFISLSNAYLSATVRSSVWWNMIVLPHAVWIVLLLNIVLLCALIELGHRDEGRSARVPFSFNDKTPNL